MKNKIFNFDRVFRVTPAETFRTLFQFSIYHKLDNWKFSIWIIIKDKGFCFDFIKIKENEEC